MVTRWDDNEPKAQRDILVRARRPRRVDPIGLWLLVWWTLLGAVAWAPVVLTIAYLEGWL